MLDYIPIPDTNLLNHNYPLVRTENVVSKDKFINEFNNQLGSNIQEYKAAKLPQIVITNTPDNEKLLFKLVKTSEGVKINVLNHKPSEFDKSGIKIASGDGIPSPPIIPKPPDV